MADVMLVGGEWVLNTGSPDWQPRCVSAKVASDLVAAVAAGGIYRVLMETEIGRTPLRPPLVLSVKSV